MYGLNNYTRWIYFSQHWKHLNTDLFIFMSSQFFSLGSGQKCRLFCLFFSWRRWKDGRVKRAGWSRDMRKGSPSIGPAHASLACIITHSLSATLPYSVTLCLFSFLPHSPFILDLLSWWLWWWWVSLYDTELSVRNTMQSWNRFSTLPRLLWRIALLLKSTTQLTHSASYVCFVSLLKHLVFWQPLSRHVSL